MKLTKQRKAYAAFLGLAAVAFLADRVFFLPAGAGAATVSPEELKSESGAASKPDKDESAKETALEGPSLASKLAQSSGSDTTQRDPFRRPWQGVTVSSGKADDARLAAIALSPEQFAATHELRAVAVNDKTKSAAVIGKRTIGIGTEVDGWKLVAIDDQSATLERDNMRVTLKLRVGLKVDNWVRPSVQGEESGKSSNP